MRTSLLALSTIALLVGCDPTGGPLEVQGVQPGSGTARGGEEITVLGQGFVQDSQVFFGDTPAATSWYDANTLVAFSPPGVAGPVDVRVVRPDAAEATATDGFQYLALDPWFAPAAAADVPVGGSALYVSADAGDIDGDGDEDLLLAGPWGGLWQWENTDRGRFVGAGTLGASGAAVVVEDFDGDGLDDVFLCGSSLGTLNRLWRGTPDGLVEVDGAPATADRCRAAEAADLDGDGRVDLALLGEDGGGSYVRVLRNRSAGAPLFVVHDGLEATDGGADGTPVVRGSAADAAVAAEAGLGTGGAAGRLACSFLGAGATCGARWDGPWPVVGEGASLHVLGGGAGTTLKVELVDGGGETFVWSAPLDGDAAALSFAVADALSDGDGGVDEPVDSLAVLAVSGEAGALDLLVDSVVLASDVGPIRVEDFDRTTFALAGDDDALAVGDLDRDGDLDLVLGGPGGTRIAWREPGAQDAQDGEAGYVTDAALEAIDAPVSALAVLPGDGFADLLAVTEATDRLLRFSGAAPVDLTDQTPLVAAVGRAAAVADVDRDGWSDVLVANDQDRDALLRRAGDDWEPWTVRVPGEAARTLDAVFFDVEPDGDLDLFLLNEDAPHRLLLSEEPPAR